MRRVHLRWVAVAAALALTAACGSTVQKHGAAGVDDGLGSAQAAGPSDGTQDTAGADQGAVGVTGGGAGAAAAGGATATTRKGATTAAAGPATGPIQLGFLTTAVSNAGSAGLNTGSSFTDREADDAVIAEVNARGGVAGRKITAVYGTTDTASSNWSNQFQAACANLTQDHKAVAVLGYAFVFLDSFEQCLAKAGVPHVYGGYQPGDAQAQREFPTLVSMANPSIDVADLTVIKGAIQSGLLTPATKFGIMIDDCGGGDRAFASSVAPYLKAQHITYQLVEGSCATGASDLTGASAAISNAELRFATSGVQLVFAGGIPLLLFMAAAQSQGYHPQYVTSAGGAALEPNAPAAQLANLHGFGWLPAVDVNANHQPYPLTAPQKDCLAMLQRHGLTPKGYNDYFNAYITCDSVALYGLALARTKGHTDAAGIVAALLAVLPSFQGASTYGGRLLAGPGERGGPAQYREWGWTAGCSCFAYRGAAYPVSAL